MWMKDRTEFRYGGGKAGLAPASAANILGQR